MKKLLLFALSISVCTIYADAQFLNRLIRSAQNAAENAVERQVEKKVEDGIDKAFNPEEKPEKTEKAEKQNTKSDNAQSTGWTCPACGTTGNTGKFCSECGTKQPEPSDGTWTCPACGTKGNTGKFCNECGAKRPDGNSGSATASANSSAPAKPAATAIYQKCDFVPGDEIFFDDPVEGEQLGEFPSHWDALGGNAEVAEINGEQVIALTTASTVIFPYMTNQNYLGDVFTLECDIWGTEFKEDDYHHGISADLILQFNNDMYLQVKWGYPDQDMENGSDITRGEFKVGWRNGTTNENGSNGGRLQVKKNDWNHIAISFNKRAFKAYFNGTRLVAVPNATQQQSLEINNSLWETRTYIKNFRLAKGAVPLYNRLQSEGKIVTYGITFETGKAELKPESMVEITRIAKLMQEDASLNFEVQGHCDNTGSDKVNDPLSQKRAEAIVAALVEQGIAANRLSAVGKGSHSPIADNSTDEGRAKNRRVEFVKK